MCSVTYENVDGWVSVPRKETIPAPFLEEGGSWVVFGKEIGEDDFLIRFPSDPQYETKEGIFHVWAELDNQIFHLTVLEKGQESGQIGRGISIETGTHRYVLQIEGAGPLDREELFLSSINIRENGHIHKRI